MLHTIPWCSYASVVVGMCGYRRQRGQQRKPSKPIAGRLFWDGKSTDTSP